MFTRYLTLTVGLAAIVAGQQSACTQNEGSRNTDSKDASANNFRIIFISSTVTGVYTPVVTSRDVVYSTTSLPRSIDTLTSVSTKLVTNTPLSSSVFTTHTLNNATSTAGAVATSTAARYAIPTPAWGTAGILAGAAAALL